MDRILNGIPPYVLLPVTLIVLLLLVVLIYKSHREGREISFWPPKIGPRPKDDEVTKSMRSTPEAQSASSATVNQESTQTPKVRAVRRLVELETGPKTRLEEVLEEYERPAVENRPDLAKLLRPISDLDIRALRTAEVIGESKYSKIEKCFFKGVPYVLKRTQKQFCQQEALKRIVGKTFVGYKNSVSTLIATPLSVWQEGDHICELHPYYDGITLHELVSSNKHCIQGSLLGTIYNSMLGAISSLQKEGVLHRDVAPSNVLITRTGDLIILDCSFCCLENSQQIPVGNSAYTPPEQLAGSACNSSEWYSIAATTYFLATGYPPDRRDDRRFREGLTRIDTGQFRALPGFAPRFGGAWSSPEFFDLLLSAAASDRPSDLWRVELTESSVVHEFSKVIGVLDMGRLGIILTQEYDFTILPRSKVDGFLQQALLFDAIAPEILEHANELISNG